MDIFTYGTLVCLSFVPVEAKFYKCNNFAKINSIECASNSYDGECKDPVYQLMFVGCTKAAYVMEERVKPRNIKPVVLWEEFFDEKGVAVKQPICPEVKK